MSGKSDEEHPASLCLSKEQEEEAFARCLRMVNFLNEMAVNTILDCIQNVSCPMAKQVLLKSPEHIALKAFEKALKDIGMPCGPNSRERVH